MSKICWKCKEPHEDGMERCPYCGATFMSGNASYRTDGRTVSDVDEDAYLRSPPPTYRRSYRMMLPMVLVVLIAAVVVYAMVDSSGVLKPDIRYDYRITYTDSGDGTLRAECDVLMFDNKISGIDWSRTVFELSGHGETYSPSSMEETNHGLVCRWSIVFDIPDAQTSEGYSLKISHPGGYSLGRDDSMLRSARRRYFRYRTDGYWHITKWSVKSNLNISAMDVYSRCPCEGAEGDIMRHWKTALLIVAYLIAMAALYVAFKSDVIGRDLFIVGPIVGSVLLAVVNRTWFLSDADAE